MSGVSNLSRGELYAKHIQHLRGQARQLLGTGQDLRKEMIRVHTLTEKLVDDQRWDTRPAEANDSINIRQAVDALVNDDLEDIIANEVSDIERQFKDLKQHARTLEEERFIIKRAPSTAARTMIGTESNYLALTDELEHELDILQSLLDNLQRQISRIGSLGGRGGVVQGRVRSPKLFH
ncbi:hypothetical protein LTR37_007356 [Vermiconidia calcicola]|uniref:Uncharacterized protein n=1 Tax=Vermiconidia calcicola TaxID=1690605 RepID=A0ACC3NFJ5_9PEZI|nr:hypothetical protein LTR37_007356 [Vermiconidia calcicola]